MGFGLSRVAGESRLFFVESWELCRPLKDAQKGHESAKVQVGVENITPFCS